MPFFAPFLHLILRADRQKMRRICTYTVPVSGEEGTGHAGMNIFPETDRPPASCLCSFLYGMIHRSYLPERVK